LRQIIKKFQQFLLEINFKENCFSNNFLLNQLIRWKKKLIIKIHIKILQIITQVLILNHNILIINASIALILVTKILFIILINNIQQKIGQIVQKPLHLWKEWVSRLIIYKLVECNLILKIKLPLIIKVVSQIYRPLILKNLL